MDEERSKKRPLPVEKPWSFSWEETAAKLKVSPEKGLDDEETRRRRQQYGLNRLHGKKTKPAWIILVNQFKNPIVALLGGASILAFSFGQWLEGFSIIAAILINTGIGFLQSGGPFGPWRHFTE
ncbi:MAG: cation-transporting P-type ATPase [Thermodesulfobacteriota bacterium]